MNNTDNESGVNNPEWWPGFYYDSSGKEIQRYNAPGNVPVGSHFMCSGTAYELPWEDELEAYALNKTNQTTG